MAESQETQTPAPETPAVETPKVSAEEFQAQVSSGDIDVTKMSQDEFLALARERIQESETPELGQPEPQPTTEEPVVKTPPEVVDEEIKFPTFGEQLKYAKEQGLDAKNAHDLVKQFKKTKEELAEREKAIDRWSRDAQAKAAQVERQAKQLQDLQSQVEALKKAPPKAEKPAPEPAPEIEEPEIPMPDELDDIQKWTTYYQQVQERNDRISERRIKSLEETMQKQISQTNASWQEKFEHEQSQRSEYEKARKENEAAARALEETIIAAEDFVNRNPEFDFGDGTSVAQKNESYTQWTSKLNYVKKQNPAYEGRDLAQDYLNGEQDVVNLVNTYGITPPVGAKQFAIIAELNAIANLHNLKTDIGRPDFKQAYALKKARDGVDIDEVNQARVDGTKQALEVVQSRQAAPPSITASDAAPPPMVKTTPEALQTKMAYYQANASTMPEAERTNLMKEINAGAAELKLTVDQGK